MRTFLLLSPNFAAAVNKRGDIYFGQTFNLASYLFSEDPTYYEEASLLVKVLFTTCPRFKQHPNFLRLSKPTPKIAERFTEITSGLEPAEALPDFQTLEAIAATLKIKRFTPPEQPQMSRKDVSRSEEEYLRRARSDLQEILRLGLRHQSFPLLELSRDLVSLLDSNVPYLEKGSTFKDLADLLSDTHRGWWTIKKVALERRQRFLARRTSSEPTQEQLEQRKVIQELEGLHKILAESEAGPFPKDLIQLNRLLTDVLDVHFSIAVAGLISVGKSTFINCLIGKDVAPHRQSTMTSIPVRYLHNPDVLQPTMIIPFYDQLNSVICKIRQLISEKENPNAYIESLKTEETRTAKRVMEKDFVLKHKYEGLQQVFEMTLFVHDLYRLGVSPEFNKEDIRNGLVNNWNVGLDQYLTISLRFPSLETLPANIGVSVVDTPGIDEEGVQELNFHQTLTDTMSACTFSVMVVDANKYAALSMVPLCQMFADLQRSLSQPSIALVTHVENYRSQALDALQEDLTAALSVSFSSSQGVKHCLFRKEQIYLGSPNLMLLGTAISDFLSKHPSEKPPYESELAQSYCQTRGWDSDEAEIEYNNLSVQHFAERGASLRSVSRMEKPIDHLLTQISQAATQSSKTAIRKAEVLASSLLHYVSVASARQVDRKKTQDAINKLRNLEASFLQEVAAQCHSLVSDLQKEITKLSGQKDTVLSMETTSLEVKKHQTEFGRLFAHLAANDPKVVKILLSSKQVVFEEEEDALQGSLELLAAGKKACLEHLETYLETLLEKLSRWVPVKHQLTEKEARETMKELGQDYQEGEKDFETPSIILQHAELQNQEKLDLRIGFQHHIQPYVVPAINRAFSRFVETFTKKQASLTDGFKVNAKSIKQEVKKNLGEFLTTLGLELKEKAQESVEKFKERAKGNMEQSVGRNILALNVLLLDDQELFEKLRVPRERLSQDLHAFLRVCLSIRGEK